MANKEKKGTYLFTFAGLLKDWFIAQIELGSIEIYLYAFALFFWMYHLIYIFDIYVRAHRLKKTNDAETGILPSISIIIAAKNEFKNLQVLIPALLKQNYPLYEIILINDGSYDETDEWASQFALKEPKLKYTFMDPAFFKVDGKKMALTLGIKKSRFEHLVLLDGDCLPPSNEYLQQYGQQFSEGKNLVLGLSPYKKHRGLLNRLIQFETYLTAGSYLALASKGKPYMGLGRNMAYTKSLYESVNGFESHYEIPCGDDDLFVQSVSKKCKVGWVLSPESMTYSEPKTTWKSYVKQKLRHLWAGKYYKSSFKRKLARLPISNLLFWGIVLISMSFKMHWFIGVFLILLKLIIKWVVFHITSKSLMKSNRISLYPLVSVVHLYFQLFTTIKLYFTKKISW